MHDEHTRARFESLLLPLMNDAYSLAFWLMKNKEDTEDMVQESYLRAFRFFTTFREGGDGRAWLLRIVRNTCYTVLAGRKGGQLTSLEEEVQEIADPGPLPSADLERKATVETVRSAIAELPVEFREALVLREIEGLAYKEISEITGVPIGTVMSRLARGRRQLYLRLAGKEH